MTYKHPFLLLSSNANELEEQGKFISCFPGAIIGINVSDHNTSHLLYNNIAPSSLGIWGDKYTKQKPQHQLSAAVWVRNNLNAVTDFLGVGSYLLVLEDDSYDTLTAACLIRMLVASGREPYNFENFVNPEFNLRMENVLTGYANLFPIDYPASPSDKIQFIELYLDNGIQ